MSDSPGRQLLSMCALVMQSSSPESPSANSVNSQISNRPTKPYICEVCGLVLARPSHLLRHRRLHLPLSQQQHFPCHQCDKSFTRKDIYLRHSRTTHQRNERIAKSKRKSCLHCVRLKLKCSRTQPCAACHQRKVDCAYQPVGSMTGDSPGNEAAHIMSLLPVGESEGSQLHSASRKTLDLQDFPISTFEGVSGFESNQELAPQTSSLEPILLDSVPTGPPLPGHHPEIFHPEGSRIHEEDILHTDTNNIDITIGVEIPEHFCNQNIDLFVENTCLTTTDDNNTQENREIIQMPECSMPNDVRIGELDWLNLELDSPQDFQTQPGSILEGETLNNGESRQLQVSEWLISESNWAYDAIQPTSAKHLTSLQPNRGLPGDLPAPAGTISQNRQQHWPFDYEDASECRKVQLPPLRHILENTVRPTYKTKPVTDSLIELLSSPYLPPIDNELELHIMPSIGLLKHFLDLYFTRFHHVMPIIHTPTWEISSSPTVLLAAVAAIGACFSDIEGALELSWSLSEISLQSISWLGGSDSTNYRDPAYLKACCIHLVYSLGSGNRRLYENADGSRGILITSLRAIGMLKSRLRSEGHPDDGAEIPSLPPRDESQLKAQWVRWKDAETEKRVTWSSFEFDCSLCTLTNRRGVVDLHELPSQLPCADALWEAPSAEAWSALMSRASCNAQGAFLPRVLREIVAPKPISNDIPAWGKRLCAQIIGRLLWDLKQLERVSASDFLGLPSLNSAHKPTRDALVKCLSNLCDSIAQPSCTADLIHLNITSLICHYSHLYTSEEVMDLVVYIFREGARGRSSHSSKQDESSDIESAIHRLKNIWAHDPLHTRAMVWHAAQIIAMAREYFIHAPCETMRVFMGQIFILAFAKYGAAQQQQKHMDAASATRPATVAVRLDEPTWRENQKSAVNRWIEIGGPASVGSVNIYDPSCVAALKSNSLQILADMRVWGLARKFAKILKGFEP
ncbi:fungal-specific transcription factor domain-containing protein [Xylogone sp. PMI_703]|nr:fungal-specific transcription factor domain-containing protein [Xylogone sp. PMI_703]